MRIFYETAEIILTIFYGPSRISVIKSNILDDKCGSMLVIKNFSTYVGYTIRSKQSTTQTSYNTLLRASFQSTLHDPVVFSSFDSFAEKNEF